MLQRLGKLVHQRFREHQPLPSLFPIVVSNPRLREPQRPRDKWPHPIIFIEAPCDRERHLLHHILFIIHIVHCREHKRLDGRLRFQPKPSQPLAHIYFVFVDHICMPH